MTNKYIDETAPWVLVKEEKTRELASVMYHLAENLRKIGILLKPIMDNTSKEILSQLGIDDEKLVTWESLKQNNLLQNEIKVIEKGNPLFVRLDMNEEAQYIKEKMK